MNAAAPILLGKSATVSLCVPVAVCISYSIILYCKLTRGRLMVYGPRIHALERDLVTPSTAHYHEVRVRNNACRNYMYM